MPNRCFVSSVEKYEDKNPIAAVPPNRATEVQVYPTLSELPLGEANAKAKNTAVPASNPRNVTPLTKYRVPHVWVSSNSLVAAASGDISAARSLLLKMLKAHHLGIR